jgi:hypothetical protein
VTQPPPSAYNRDVDPAERSSRFRSFLLGGILGSLAGLAAAGRVGTSRRPERTHRAATGLAAFEEAPCYRETLERERRERQ